MTGPELDALIRDVEHIVEEGGDVDCDMAESLVSELKIYRSMSLRLERCVRELVKEAESCESL